MNTYSQTLYKVKKTKSGSDEISQGQYTSKCSLLRLVALQLISCVSFTHADTITQITQKLKTLLIVLATEH